MTALIAESSQRPKAAARTTARTPRSSWRHPESGEQAEDRLFGRAAEIGRVLGRYGLQGLFDGHEGVPASVRARQLTAALEELGPTFAKIGQLLSTRPDLLPPEYVEELATLQEHVAPLPLADLVAVVDEELAELGLTREQVFATIDPEPLGSGTIAQVHRAALTDGRPVVVKVQRPGARLDIMRDLGLLELFATKAAARPGLTRVVDIPALVDHLSVSLERELDFRREADSLGRLRRTLAPYRRLGVPRAFPELTTTRLLVMEEVAGCPVAEAPDVPERAQAARQLVESFYHQILGAGLFHADPHPGNLRWSDGRIWFLDLGMVGEVSPETRELLLLFMLALRRGDVHFLVDVLVMLGGETPAKLDLTAIRDDLSDLVNRLGGASLTDVDFGAVLEELGLISGRHGFRLPAALALVGKALAQVQLATARLDPSLEPFGVAAAYAAKSMAADAGERSKPESVLYEARKLGSRLSRLFEAVERVAGARPGAPLRVEVAGVDRLEQAVAAGLRRLSLAVLAAACLIPAGLTAPVGWLPAALAAAGGLAASLLGRDLLRRRA